jgi:beta-carotene 3-hydroxylase
MMLDLLVVIAAVAAMEGVAYLTHRYVMHGQLGWDLHRDHHEPAEGHFERNDLYALGFAGIVTVAFILGEWVWPLKQLAIGATIYGILYFIVHDGLVHQRWPFRHVPRRGYLRRLYQAHKLHHATEGREGAVSFGFLYAPPIRALKDELARGQRPDARRSDRPGPELGRPRG